ncbi:MAG: F0F1 ATP synthase subunit A [Bacteroidota bacterium]
MRLTSMRSAARLLFVLAGFALISTPARAAGDGEFDAIHHTADGKYLDFLPIGKVELPRLFVTRDAEGSLGFDFFWSSTAAVESGDYAIDTYGEEGDAEYGAEGGDLANELATETEQEILGEEAAGGEAEGPPPYDSPLVATGGAEIVLDLSITRHLIFVLIIICVLCLLFIPMAGKYKKGIGRTSAPQGLLQNMLETVIVYIRDEIAKPNLGDKHEKFLPYLLTLFFFIIGCNLVGLVPFGATATANITITAVLAIITFIVTQAAGTKDYWMHILWPPGIPAFVKPILVPIEILGLFTKPFALAVRLFANMTAGHLVILNLIGLIFLVGGMNATAGYATSVPAMFLTVFIYCLEVLVAFIQAYVFTILSALFIGMAAAEHEHDHDHSEDHGLDAHDLALQQSTPLVNGAPHKKEHERTVGTEAALA